MPALNLIISPPSKIFRSISLWLAEHKKALCEAGFQTSGTARPALGPVSVNTLTNICDLGGQSGKVTVENILESYEKELSPERHIIWLARPFTPGGLTLFKASLLKSEFFSGYKVRVIHIVQNPLQRFVEQIALRWKTPQNPQALLTDFLDAGTGFFRQAEALEKVFGDKNFFFLPFKGDYAAFGREFLAALGLPGDFPAPTAPPWPLSFAGLDFLKACAEFPFSIFPKKYNEERDFVMPLVEAEKEAGYPVFNHLPPEMTLRIQAAFKKPNRLFIGKYGKRFAFLNDWPQVSPMPKKRPGLVTTSCEVFLNALEPTFRKEIEDYFSVTRLQWKMPRLITKVIAEKAKKAQLSRPAKKPLLSVLTLAHNHRDYITQCMESVAEQITDFPVEHIIVDDLSSDGTQDIIDNFASRHSHVRPIYLPFTKRGRNIERLFNACRSPYAALCDGDDYFIHVHKLQRQHDFLEKNRDCGLCFHFVETRFEDGERAPFIFPKRSMLPGGVREKYALVDLLRGNFIQTNSVLYRWRFQDGLPDWFQSRLCPADWYWHILHAETGLIGFIPEIWSVYRKHKRSIYANSFQASSLEHHRAHGLGELQTFAAINDHFQDRYFDILAGVANGVFADYCQIFNEEDDSSWLDKGMELYPKFGAFFLKSLRALENPGQGGNANL